MRVGRMQDLDRAAAPPGGQELADQHADSGTVEPRDLFHVEHQLDAPASTRRFTASRRTTSPSSSSRRPINWRIVTSPTRRSTIRIRVRHDPTLPRRGT